MSFSAKGLHARSFKTSRTVFALMMREMVTTYGRSPGGYIWALLEPIGGLAVMTIAFSLALPSPALGNNFPLFYATGFLPFMMYLDLSGKLGNAIRFSKPLLAYPSVTYLDAIVARFLLNALTHLMVIYILMYSIIHYFDTGTIINYPAVLNAIAMSLSLSFGVGVLNCYLLTRFPLYERIWGIVTKPLFIVSTIFFLMETLPKKFQDLLWYNPLVHVVGEMRRGFYATYEPSWVSSPYIYGMSFLMTTLGLIFLGRYHRELLSRL